MTYPSPLDIAPPRSLISGSSLPAALIAAAVVVLICFAVYFIKNRRK